MALSSTSSGSFATTPSNTTLIGGVGSSRGPGNAYVYTLNYTKNGNIASAFDAYNGSWNYAYDTLNRLSSAAYYPYEGSGVFLPGGTYNYQCWTYDGFGNRIYELDTNTSTDCPATSANHTNQMEMNVRNQVTAVNGNALTPDAAGNTIQDPNYNYIYDLESRRACLRLWPAVWPLCRPEQKVRCFASG